MGVAATGGSAKADAPEPLSDQGHKLLWVAFLGLAVPTAYFWQQTMAQPDGSRKYHIITFGITAIASLAYLTMATGHGVYIREFDGREFFYARYVDWAFTTPLQLLDICGFAGASNDQTLWLLGVDFLMIIAGLIGAFLEGQEKYYFWLFGMCMFMPISALSSAASRPPLPPSPRPSRASSTRSLPSPPSPGLPTPLSGSLPRALARSPLTRRPWLTPSSTSSPSPSSVSSSSLLVTPATRSKPSSFCC